MDPTEGRRLCGHDDEVNLSLSDLWTRSTLSTATTKRPTFSSPTDTRRRSTSWPRSDNKNDIDVGLVDEVDLVHGPDVGVDLLLHGPDNDVDIVVGPDDEVDLLIGSDDEGDVVRSSSGPWTRSISSSGPTMMSTSSKATRTKIDLVIGSEDEVDLVIGSVDEVDLVIGSDNEVKIALELVVVGSLESRK